MTAPETTTTPNNMQTSGQGIPVTILTGFLGSGKTTLLNHILTNQQGVKTAVLVNEFGEIGIDNELVVTTDDNMVALSNGCICCTINDDLLNAVYKILERPEKVDYIVVETTGLADPLPVALTFLGTELRDLTRLDSIVTLVDCENFSLDLFNSQAAYSQIAYGDIILLNKTDLVEAADVDLLEVKVRDIKPDARILRTSHSKVALPLILSVGLFESDRFYQPDDENGHEGHDHHDREHHDREHHDHDHHGHDHHDREGHEHHDHHSHDHHSHDQHHDHHGHEGHDHHHGHEHHGHDHHGHDHHGHDHHHHSDHLAIDGFLSVSFESDQPLALKDFQDFLDNKLPATVFRAKGILWFQESDRRHIFHLSGKRFTIEDEDWKGKPKNQLVLIGQDLDSETLLSQIQQCVVQG